MQYCGAWNFGVGVFYESLHLSFGGDELVNAGTKFDLSTGRLAVRKMQDFDLSTGQLEPMNSDWNLS